MPFPLSQEPSLSGVGMAAVSTRTMDVLNFVGVVDVPSIVSVVSERFQFYQHIHHPSVTGMTQFLTSTLPRSMFTPVSGRPGDDVHPLIFAYVPMSLIIGYDVCRFGQCKTSNTVCWAV